LFDIWFQKYPYFNVLFNCSPRIEGEGIFGRMAGISTEMLLHFFSDSCPKFFSKMPSTTAAIRNEDEGIFGRMAEEKGSYTL
jgi:hypothetical protein